VGSKRILILNAVLVLCSCSAVAVAGNREAGLAAQFKAAAPAERAKLAGNLSHRNDTPEMVAALAPFLESDDAELRADTAYVLRGFHSRALQSAAPALLAAVNHDPAWRVRANAAYALMTIPETGGTLAAFGKCAADADARVRAACAKGLGTAAKARQGGDNDVIPLLATDLGDTARLVRYGAAIGFQELASTEPAATHALAARLDVEPDPWVRGTIARAIAASGAAAEPALPALTRAVLDPLPLYTASQVVAAMAAIGAPAVPTLIATLGYRGPAETGSSRRAAIAAKAALVKLEVPMTAALIAAVQRGPAQQRMFAAEVLGEKAAEGTSAIPALEAALKDDDARVRRAAATSLGQLTTYDSAALPALLDALKDPDSGVRESAVDALDNGLDGAFVGNDRALSASRAGKPVPKPVDVLPSPMVAQTARALGARLGDADITVAAIAAQALGKMGPRAAPALPPLEAALLAPDGENARDAADALAAMGVIGAPVLIEAVRKGASPADGSGIGIRGRAAAALATLGWQKQLGDYEAAAVAALIGGLSDPRSDVRGEVAEALGNLGHAGDAPSMKGRVVAALKGAMDREQDDNAKQSMQLAMRNWGAGS
jgi:HEAT repeat protein